MFRTRFALITVAVLLGSASTALATASRAEALPTLSAKQARYYSKVASRRYFKQSFFGDTFKADACSRRSRVRVRCRVSWYAGDTSWSGHTVIWLTDEDDGVNWNYAFGITRLYTYCADVLMKPESECSKTYRVR